MPRIGDEEWSELQDFKHKFKRVDINVIYILSIGMYFFESVKKS